MDVAGDGDAVGDFHIAVDHIPAFSPCGGAVYHVDAVFGIFIAIFVPILYVVYRNRQRRRQLIPGQSGQRRQRVPRRFKAGGVQPQGVLLGQLRPRLANGFKLGLHPGPVLGGDVLWGRKRVDHGLHRADVADISAGTTLHGFYVAAVFIAVFLVVMAQAPGVRLHFRRKSGEWEQTDQHRRRQETSQQSLFHGHDLHIKAQKFPSARGDLAPQYCGAKGARPLC